MAFQTNIFSSSEKSLRMTSTMYFYCCKLNQLTTITVYTFVSADHSGNGFWIWVWSSLTTSSCASFSIINALFLLLSGRMFTISELQSYRNMYDSYSFNFPIIWIVMKKRNTNNNRGKNRMFYSIDLNIVLFLYVVSFDEHVTQNFQKLLYHIGSFTLLDCILEFYVYCVYYKTHGLTLSMITKS